MIVVRRSCFTAMTVNAHTRRAVAYVAGRLVTGSESGAVYDYSESRHVNFSGTVSDQNVNVYDYDEGCFVSGSPASLYHYGDGQFIQLNVNGAQLSGYDYGSGQHFSGSVQANSVTVYDYEHGSYFNYAI
jgi:hypothetical protein